MSVPLSYNEFLEKFEDVLTNREDLETIITPLLQSFRHVFDPFDSIHIIPCTGQRHNGKPFDKANFHVTGGCNNCQYEGVYLPEYKLSFDRLYTYALRYDNGVVEITINLNPNMPLDASARNVTHKLWDKEEKNRMYGKISV